MAACTIPMMKTRILTELIGYLHIRMQQHQETSTGATGVLCDI